jgi:hypothetical protein
VTVKAVMPSRLDPPDMPRLDVLDEEFGENAAAVLHARRRRIGERLLMLAIVALCLGAIGALAFAWSNADGPLRFELQSAATPLISSMLCLQNATRTRVGLAAAAAPQILPKNHRCLSAERLEFAESEENCQHLLASDDHQYQGAAQHSAFDLSHRRVLAALEDHHSLISKA